MSEKELRIAKRYIRGTDPLVGDVLVVSCADCGVALLSVLQEVNAAVDALFWVVARHHCAARKIEPTTAAAGGERA